SGRWCSKPTSTSSSAARAAWTFAWPSAWPRAFQPESRASSRARANGCPMRLSGAKVAAGSASIPATARELPPSRRSSRSTSSSEANPDSSTSVVAPTSASITAGRRSRSSGIKRCANSSSHASMSSAVFGLGVPRGAYTERVEPRRVWLDETASAAAGPMIRWIRGRDPRWTRIVALVRSEGVALAGAGSRPLQGAALALRSALHRGGLREDLVARPFALVREAATQTLGLRHFDVQLMGGRILLSGMVAEMETGEGKTLTATLPACTMALAGVPVHVITVNDYLVQRDAEWMGPI